MKKLFLVISLLLSINSRCTVSEYLDKARLTIGGIVDLALGSGSISQEDEQLIKELQAKAGIKGEIPVRNLNMLARIILGYENAFACGPGIYNRIYANKEWLSELTKEEKEFLFAHELMHIKHKDAFWLWPTDLLKKLIDKRYSAIARQKLLSYAVSCATRTFANTVSRSCEKHADRDAVKLLKTGKGGVQLVRTVRNFKVQGPWYRKAHAIINKISYPILSLPVLKKMFLGHPTYEDRMNYIAAAGFEQEQQVAQDNSENTRTDSTTECACAL